MLTPLQVNRRRFLSCSAVAGLALTQGVGAEETASRPVRIGLHGLGNRGTNLLRTLLELPGVEITAIVDAEAKHRTRALGILERAGRSRPSAKGAPCEMLDREDVDAVVSALPCDLHLPAYHQTIEAGKHLYAEKPLGLSLAECDHLIALAADRPEQAVHVGLQRRSNPRYQEAVSLIRTGALGTLVEARLAWTSSNGPVNGHNGWLAQRSRSGDWMVEQGVHVWDLLHWLTGSLPVRAFGAGRRDLFADTQPSRDVTDHYRVVLEWASGFSASFVQSWIDPADGAFTGSEQRLLGTAGGLDLTTGIATFRDRGQPRQTLHPGPAADTRLALAAFVDGHSQGPRPHAVSRLAGRRPGGDHHGPDGPPGRRRGPNRHPR